MIVAFLFRHRGVILNSDRFDSSRLPSGDSSRQPPHLDLLFLHRLSVGLLRERY
jgi:hypothetical protein